MENITETIKKFVDPTIREMKRQVNLKILKVSVIEQKVLDATDNGPSGPGDLALAEIAQATETLSGCHTVMDVLWTRLRETGNDNWRRVYKSLAVIEYLVRNGSEYAVRDIVQHNSQISALASFEYIEPHGKDMRSNVRQKIVSLLSRTR